MARRQPPYPRPEPFTAKNKTGAVSRLWGSGGRLLPHGQPFSAAGRYCNIWVDFPCYNIKEKKLVCRALPGPRKERDPFMKVNISLRRSAAALLAAAVLALGLTGCGSSSQAVNDTAFSQESTAASPGESGSGALLDPGAVDNDRKIVYTATLRMETTDFAASQQAILDAVDAAGGYLQSSSMSANGDEGSARSCYYTVRVPVDNYQSFLAAAGGAGNVLFQDESAQDVGAQYIDVEARLASLEEQRTRLTQLAAQAETTADLLEIESQLADVQYQIESYTAQKRDLDNRITYSTVDITLDEVVELTPAGSTFGERVVAAVAGGWRDFVRLLELLLLTVLYLMPLLILAAAVTVVCILLVRRHRKRRPATAKPAYMVPPPPAAPQARPANPGQPDTGAAPGRPDAPDRPPQTPQPPKPGPKY